MSGTTSVSFGATPATGITVLDRELVIVHAPAHAPGAVHVTLSATGGETTSSLTYTYKAVAPTVTGISPAEGTALGSTLVTVSGSGFPTEPGGISFIFGKTAATNVECTSTTTCTSLTRGDLAPPAGPPPPSRPARARGRMSRGIRAGRRARAARIRASPGRGSPRPSASRLRRARA